MRWDRNSQCHQFLTVRNDVKVCQLEDQLATGLRLRSASCGDPVVFAAVSCVFLRCRRKRTMQERRTRSGKWKPIVNGLLDLQSGYLEVQYLLEI